MFNTYLILGARWLSHHEAIQMILLTGRYGDCMVLLRSLLEDTDLITYFASYPKEAAEWNERLSRAPEWSDQAYRNGIQKFRMRNIWQKLKSKGIEPLGERDYSLLSTTVHASPWGARFYGRIFPEDPSRLHLNFAPLYDPAASFTVGLVLQGTYPRPVEAFLKVCEASTATKTQWSSIKADYDSLIAGWQAKMKFDSWFRVAMDDAEERLSRGEDPEVVQADMAKRFHERYRQPTDPEGGDTASG